MPRIVRMLMYVDDHFQNSDEKTEVDEASIYFKQPTINQDDWIQSKAYSYSVSGSNEDLIRSETADENGAVTGNLMYQTKPLSVIIYFL